MLAKCPHCEQILVNLNFEVLVATETGNPRNGWKTVVVTCPLCHSALGAQTDPVAIQTDILNAVENNKREIQALSASVNSLLRQRR